jgi:quercetin dioxygenase-like cupin family protein
VSAPRRIVTGHDASGRSVVLSDGPNPKMLDIGTGVFHELWSVDAVPAPLDAEQAEPTERPVRVPPSSGGVLARVTVMAPGAVVPLHRTETVDIGVVLDGETWLTLDDGSETSMGVGDVVIQRGTNHGWENRSSDRAVRMLFVQIDGVLSDGVRSAAGPLTFFDQVLG